MFDIVLSSAGPLLTVKVSPDVDGLSLPRDPNHRVNVTPCDYLTGKSLPVIRIPVKPLAQK